MMYYTDSSLLDVHTAAGLILALRALHRQLLVVQVCVVCVLVLAAVISVSSSSSSDCSCSTHVLEPVVAQQLLVLCAAAAAAVCCCCCCNYHVAAAAVAAAVHCAVSKQGVGVLSEQGLEPEHVPQDRPHVCALVEMLHKLQHAGQSCVLSVVVEAGDQDACRSTRTRYAGSIST
eukprot:2549-Heterococcus_DN1.PRE.1